MFHRDTASLGRDFCGLRGLIAPPHGHWVQITSSVNGAAGVTPSRLEGRRSKSKSAEMNTYTGAAEGTVTNRQRSVP